MWTVREEVGRVLERIEDGGRSMTWTTFISGVRIISSGQLFACEITKRSSGERRGEGREEIRSLLRSRTVVASWEKRGKRISLWQRVLMRMNGGGQEEEDKFIACCAEEELRREEEYLKEDDRWELFVDKIADDDDREEEEGEYEDRIAVLDVIVAWETGRRAGGRGAGLAVKKNKTTTPQRTGSF
jgi:hypothetical protein